MAANVYPGRRPLGPPNASSLGAALFGPENGPIMAFEGGGGVEDEAVYDNGPDYEGRIVDYLNRLREPATLPAPPPIPKGTALAMAMNPQYAGEMLAFEREPHQRATQEFDINRQNEAHAAGLAERMLSQREARAERTFNRHHLYEQSAVNAGNVGYPYQIPGNRQAAQRNNAAMMALTGQRNRSNMGMAGVRPKFATKQHHLVWLEGRMTSRQNQLSQMYAASSLPNWDDNSETVKQDSESDYKWLRRQREAIKNMSDDQWQRFSQLTEQEQDAVIEAMQGEAPGAEMPPGPWAGDAYGGKAPPRIETQQPTPYR